MTEEEIILRSFIKLSKLLNTKFRRQHSTGHYILDFYVPEIKLSIEIDGSRHYTGIGQEYDNNRTEFLKSCGVTEMRFTNSEIRNNINSVLKILGEMIGMLRNK